MKGVVIGTFTLVFLFTTACQKESKHGVKCDEPSVISLVEETINNNLSKGDISVKIDPMNIIEWDYKNGRFLCKAKISGTYKKNMSYLKKISLATYGIDFDSKNNKLSGWIFYQTFLPTVEMEKLKKHKEHIFYVEILNASQLPTW